MSKHRLLFYAFMTAWIISGCASHRDRIAEYHAAYGFPLASPGALFGSLPPPVQRSVRAEAGSAEIQNIDKFQRPEGPVFRIEFRNKDLYPALYIAADGSLLNPDLTIARGAPADTTVVITGAGMKVNELPPAVWKTIAAREPGAEIVSMSKDTWGDRVIYIVSFKDPAHHPRLHVTADGTVLNEGPK